MTTRKWHAIRALVVASVVFGSIVMGVSLYWTLRPYSDLTIEPLDPEIVTDEHTPKGMPIVRRGDGIRFLLDYCNYDVDVQTSRQLQSYGRIGAFAGDGVTPTGSVALPDYEFFPLKDSCGEDFLTLVRVPAYVESGEVYRLNSNNVYQPNPIRR